MNRLTVLLMTALCASAQLRERDALPPPDARPPASEETSDGGCLLKSGMRIPLTLMNTVSSKNAAAGDQIYLQTMIPVFVNRRLVIPAGSHVKGTITQSVRPGKVKGRGELYLRFDSIQMDNGVVLDLSGRMGALDGGNPGQLSRDEGKVTSDSGAGKDVAVAAGTTVGGAAMGNWIGGYGRDAGIGAAAGAAAGLGAILLTRGPDSVLQRGSVIELVLSRDLKVAEDELPGNSPRARAR